MKTLLNAASLGLIAIMGLAGLTACSSSDDAGEEPNVNPGESVKTSFTLSVGLPNGNRSNAKPATRVSDEVAQVNNDFRGIDNICLLPFNDAVTGSSTSNAGKITLTDMTTSNVASTNNERARVYNDVNINVGTKNFLFYGKAINAAASSTLSSDFTNGNLTVAGLSSNGTTISTSAINFTPASIYSGNVDSESKATALVAYLNSIVGTTYTPSNATESSTWTAYAGTDANASRPLTALYNNFISLVAGSSASIETTVQELYTSLMNLSTETGGNNLTTDEAALRDAIVKNITSSTYVSNGEGATANTKLAFQENINGFPGSINLPDGAATLTFDKDSKQFTENSAAMSLKNGTDVASLSNFAYPANLWYFANSQIKTSEEALSDQYVSGTSWADMLAKYSNDNSAVSEATRSIALKNQIQYAVGRLEATVKAGATTLYDANGAAVQVGDQSFPVSAIIIGGQRQVDWEFKPVVTDGATQYSLYDKYTKNIYANTASGTLPTNSTLVLETPAKEKVNIAIELTNNSGQRFKGRDGIVPVGGKFYLVAQLDPSSTTQTSQPAGASSTIDKVFLQDYVTKANLKINANTDSDNRNQGLGNAYTVIPDLRIPVLSIGMSVDLTWQNGLTFNVDM